MKERIINIVEMILSLGLIPLWFVKFFHGIGHLPCQSDPNTIVQVDFYHSMYENINADTFGFMFPVSMLLIAISVIFSTICLKFPNKRKMQKVGLVIFGITVGAFLSSLLLASTVGRGY